MSTSILATKLHIPRPRLRVIHRPRLVEHLNERLHRKLTLISAPAGFGKTTLISEWLGSCELPIAWLSLDEQDKDPTRFLMYLIAALQTVTVTLGEGLWGALQSPQPPPINTLLIALINDLATIPDNFLIVLDDYHVIDSKPIDNALTFLIEHLPPQIHLVIATREDPHLPLARLRASGDLTELRATDLRFTLSEAAEFLTDQMQLKLSAKDIATLETRTEGWIAGLQLAAISMQGHNDPVTFVKSFSGSHHFVLDYLLEEVLHQQPDHIQTFLLCTSILDRLCGSLCDAVTGDLSTSGRKTLEYIEHANLFIVPLDNERRWYRYHHLFADLLRQRLNQNANSSPEALPAGVKTIAELHMRASIWYEHNGLMPEAFHHATAANDIERAEHLIESGGLPMHFRGAVTTIVDWLDSLPKTVRDAKPSLWAKSASLSLILGQPNGVEEKLQAAEAALQSLGLVDPVDHVGLDDKTRNLVGQIAATRATLALSQYKVDTIIVQAHRALEYLRPDNLALRTTAIWSLGYAYQHQGDRAAATRAYAEAVSISQASGDIFFTILATIGFAQIQELENQLYAAVETYQRSLQMFGDHPQPNACEAHIGLARIYYEWNDLNAAQQHGEQSLRLARQFDTVIDRSVISEVFLARLKLARRDVDGAAGMLMQLDQLARQNNFVYRLPEIAAAQVLTLLHQGNVAAAAHLAQTHDLPLSQARVYIVQGDTSAALAMLESLYGQVAAKGWVDERLKVMVLQVMALYAHGTKDAAVQLLRDALTLAESGGFIRIFVDEGLPMVHLLSETTENEANRVQPTYISKLLSAFEAEKQAIAGIADDPSRRSFEPLSQRELEVLRLIAHGLSNHEIGAQLFLALDTVKGHNRRLFEKLQVQRRTEAVARARELGLL